MLHIEESLSQFSISNETVDRAYDSLVSICLSVYEGRVVKILIKLQLDIYFTSFPISLLMSVLFPLLGTPRIAMHNFFPFFLGSWQKLEGKKKV